MKTGENAKKVMFPRGNVGGKKAEHSKWPEVYTVRRKFTAHRNFLPYGNLQEFLTYTFVQTWKGDHVCCVPSQVKLQVNCIDKRTGSTQIPERQSLLIQYFAWMWLGSFQSGMKANDLCNSNS